MIATSGFLTALEQARREGGGKRGKFSRAPRRLGAPPSLKNTESGTPDGFFIPKICIKSIFGRGSAPDPAGGAFDAPPNP